MPKDRRDRSHRKPPRPPFWNIGPGRCRFCGEPTLGENGKANTRLRWHRTCAQVWRFANDRFFARQVVRIRDGRICADCKTECAEDDWHVDHIEPLVAGSDLAMFLPGNTQTLCTGCHKIKSASEQKLKRVDKTTG